MLLREYAIKWWFVIPPLLTNVSALPGETWTPEMVSFWSCCILCLENNTAFGICCQLCLVLELKSVHCSVASQLAERSRLRAEQCEEAWHRSWTPAALSANVLLVADVSKLGCTELFFVKLGVKVDGRYWDDECRRYSKPKECHFWDTVYCMTEKHNFRKAITRWYPARTRTHDPCALSLHDLCAATCPATLQLCASVTELYNSVPANRNDLFGWESNRGSGGK